MEILDYIIMGAIVIAALWYLYRKLVVNRGCTCGSPCSKGVDEQKSCPAARGKDITQL